MSQTAENYLVDLGREILALARESQREAASSADAFDKGRQMAFYEVLTLMRQQAQVFGLSDEAVSIKGVNLEELLT